VVEKARRRAPSRWGEGGGLRQEIIVAAGRLLADSGSEEGLSLRAVAREVGIAAPSIYLHFKDRSELVVAVMQEVYGELAADLAAARARGMADGGPEAGVREMAHRYCAFALENPRRYRLMFGVEQNTISAERAADHPVQQIIGLWTEALEACAKSGRTERTSLARPEVLLWAGLHGLLALWAALPFDPELGAAYAYADDLIAVLLTD
jgi:AcrR family transcriptional regulator